MTKKEAIVKAYKILTSNKKPFAVIYGYIDNKNAVYFDKPLIKRSQEEVEAFEKVFRTGKQAQKIIPEVLYQSHAYLIGKNLKQLKLIEGSVEYNKTKTGIYATYDDFGYNGHTETYMYDVPLSVVVTGVQDLFRDNGVTIVGSDKNIWNLIVNLNSYDTIINNPTFIDYCKDACREDAYDAFVADKKDWQDLEDRIDTL